MDRPIYFCKSWFAAKRVPTEVWTEVQAREAHEAGRVYTVLVDSVDRPFCVIVVTKKFVGVDFLDEHLRESLSYHFQEVSPGQLFLTMAVHREFDGEMDQVKNGTSYSFSQDGGVQVRREFFVPSHSVETAHVQADLTANYVPFPRFGEYEEFTKIERQS